MFDKILVQMMKFTHFSSRFFMFCLQTVTNDRKKQHWYPVLISNFNTDFLFKGNHLNQYFILKSINASRLG